MRPFHEAILIALVLWSWYPLLCHPFLAVNGMIMSQCSIQHHAHVFEVFEERTRSGPIRCVTADPTLLCVCSSVLASRATQAHHHHRTQPRLKPHQPSSHW